MSFIPKLFNPRPEVGALEISDLALKFLSLGSGPSTALRINKLRQVSLPLPPGVINRGKIIDRPRLVRILANLHQQIQSPKKPVQVVLVVPASVAQAQAFTMPLVPPSEVEATAEMNLRSLAPGDIGSFYHSYEIIGGSTSSPYNQRGRIEALAAFANAQQVDELIGVLKDANFNAVVVEFPGLALSRLIKEYCEIVNPEAPTLVVNLSDDGPEIIVIKNGHHLDFSQFHYWAAIQEEIGGRQLKPEDVKEFLSRQIKEVLNFHSSRLGAPIKEAALITNPLGSEIAKMVKENFALDLQILTVSKFSEVLPVWYTALGAATRGLLPRRQDRSINLAPAGVEKDYQGAMLLEFVKSWRNAILATLGFALVAFLAATSFLIQKSASFSEKVLDPKLASLTEISELQTAARNFNKTLDLALSAQDSSPDWSLPLEKIKSLAGSKVAIERLSIETDLSVFLVGRAVSDSAMIGFKNDLAKDPSFSEVVLPLSNVKVNSDGTVSFNLQFKILLALVQ